MSNPKVELHIANYGVITLELDAAKAPKTVANFLNYVNKGHYANTVFHRDRKSTRLNSSHIQKSRMPSSA